MEDVLQQFYHDARSNDSVTIPPLTGRELVVKAKIVQCVCSLLSCNETEILHLVRALRAEGLSSKKPSARQTAFVAASLLLVSEPLASLFEKM